MLTTHVAVVPYEPGLVEERDLLHVTAALQVQLVRDLGPIWGISGTVAPFFRLEDVPPGYWPLALVEDIPYGRRGLHFASGGRPFALVRKDAGWSRMASHELLELAIDPWGNRTVAGRSLRDEFAADEYDAPQGQVEYLVEICDPCQLETYTINGVLVSDFVTPQYYDPFATSGARYSFKGAVTGPRTVLHGGYLTWRDPESREIWQAFGTDGRGSRIAPEFAKLTGSSLPSDVSLREWVDDFGDPRGVLEDLDPAEQPLLGARRSFEAATDSADAYGKALRRDIRRTFEGIGQPRSARVARSSEESDSVVQLVCALGEDDELRARFERDPRAELEARGIAVPGDFPEGAIRLRSKEQFQAACASLTDEDEPSFGPFWWLAVLGGG